MRRPQTDLEAIKRALQKMSSTELAKIIVIAKKFRKMKLPQSGLGAFKRTIQEMSSTELEELIDILKKYREVFGVRRDSLISDFYVSLAHGAYSPKIDGYDLFLKILNEEDLKKLEKAKKGLS